MAPTGSNVKPSTVTPLDSVLVELAPRGFSSDEPDDATAYTMPVISSNATSTTAPPGSQRTGLRAGAAAFSGLGSWTRGMSVVLATAISGTTVLVKPSPVRSTSAWSG